VDNVQTGERLRFDVSNELLARFTSKIVRVRRFLLGRGQREDEAQLPQEEFEPGFGTQLRPPYLFVGSERIDSYWRRRLRVPDAEEDWRDAFFLERNGA
jgi:hypothetical protein